MQLNIMLLFVFSILTSLIIQFLITVTTSSEPSSDFWRIGIGIADITGPIGEVNMMGYARAEQQTNGIHLRLKSRCFIFASTENLLRRLVFCSIDTGMVSHRVKKLAISKLNQKLNTAVHYSLENIMISSTHTHAGPGGYMDELLYHVTSLGVISSVREAISHGIAESIYAAHQEFETSGDSRLTIHFGDLKNASVNRSPDAFMNNPESERRSFSHSTVDERMTMLVIRDAQSHRLRGVLNWFPVHGTSMDNHNMFVSGDNKGFASYLWELEERLSGNEIIAAFCQSNSGDVSPNLEPPRCEDTGEKCDGNLGSCRNDTTKCIALGPGRNDVESTKIIGKRQFEAAKHILGLHPHSATSMGLDYRHRWINMSNIYVNYKRKRVKTCPPAMGFRFNFYIIPSFAAGTTDGPGSNFAHQGANSPSGLSKVLNVLRDWLKTPSEDQKICHYPKQILLSTGEMEEPYRWQPQVVPIQLFKLGRDFVIIGFPAEITTMAGRRLRKAIFHTLYDQGSISEKAQIVIAGLSNSYASYVTTFEEYQVQRYEGGSTLFGPYTLLAFEKEFSLLCSSFKSPPQAYSNESEPVDIKKELSYLPPILLDTPPLFKWFGAVRDNPMHRVRIGDTVRAVFHCSHPRPHTSTFMAVEKLVDNTWIQILSDDGWDTRFFWERFGAAESLCTVEWSIGETFPVAAGLYRLRYFGTHTLFGYHYKHTGASDPFTLLGI